MAPYTSLWSDLTQVEFSQGFMQAGPYRTRYLRAGSSDKPLLLLLHGTTGHAEAYVRNLAAHATDFNVYAVDFIGHGYSTKPEHPLEIIHYVEHVLEVIGALGYDKAHLSGESLGGWVAARIAQLHPEKVERLVLNTMGGTMANPVVMERVYTLSMEAAKDPTWARVKTRLEWLMADPRMVNDDLIRTRQMIFEQPEWPVACEMGLALQDPEIRKRNMLSDDDLRAIAAPALVIWTTRDPSGPVEEGRRIADLIPRGSVAVIEDAGHWPQYEQAETFNRLSSSFLRGSDEGPGYGGA